jgi:hypothetical protein
MSHLYARLHVRDVSEGTVLRMCVEGGLPAPGPVGVELQGRRLAAEVVKSLR